MSTPWSWSRGGRRQADKVRWSWKVTEMGWGTDKGGKRHERKEGRSYHDSVLRAPLCMLTAPIPDLCITKSNPCGPHAAHLPSLWACTTHIAIQGSGLAGSPVAKAAPLFHFSSPVTGSQTNLSHGPSLGKFFFLSNPLTFHLLVPIRP